MSESSLKKAAAESTGQRLVKKRIVSSTAATRTKPLPKPASLIELEEVDRSSAKDSSKSATVHKLEREVQELRKENASLKKELTEVRAIYDQLVLEQPSECFNERRVLMLKSQIIQLERQLLLFTHSLESRSTSLLEANNKLDNLIEELQRKASTLKLNMTKEDITHQLDLLNDLKKTLNRPTQLSVDKLAQPLMFLNSFVNPRVEDGGQHTLLDICCGKMDLINLRQVARLESKLAHLYQNLVGLQSSINVLLHCHGVDVVADENLQQCCCDLLQLSLLMPSAPWPSLKSSQDEFGFTVDSIITSLPPFVRDKKEGRDVIHGAVKAFTYANNMLQSKCNSLTKELSFYESVYKLQIDHISSFYQSVITAYDKFAEEVRQCISKPLNAILVAYDELSQFATDEALRHLLSVFHEHHDKLREVVSQLDGHKSQGVEVLTQFGKSFFDALITLEQQHSGRK
ncbi:putative leucine-rich repeat-containing protein DDB_G0290503 isoform X2 [Dysidea avara]|uniref:putative leucine-rich repeat-containing protein DDB_G0290503 isoform X2 n=1 Tax=Dysidea avara TaxID=196820 RepID=UPI00331E64BB